MAFGCSIGACDDAHTCMCIESRLVSDTRPIYLICLHNLPLGYIHSRSSKRRPQLDAMLPRSLALSNGHRMPSLGLGTWQQRDPETVRRVVRQALGAGYRLIDTASAYRNEAAIGEALAAAFGDPRNGLCRADVWITSKLSPKQQGYELATAAVLSSLHALQTDYVDLYLVHWPGASGQPPESAVHRACREASWKALEAL
ncbi:hypothetical protein GGI07_005935, partial [Coemansia sp. Benny D115]